MANLVSAVPLESLRGGTLPEGFDALVVVSASPVSERAASLGPTVAAALEAGQRADAALGKGKHAPCVVPAPGVAGGRLVLGCPGPLTDPVDDVRQVAESAAACIARAVDAGATRPLLAVLSPDTPRFAHALDVAALAALGTRWAPLEAREAGKAPRCIEGLGVVGSTESRAKRVEALEAARSLARDIAGTEPERMAPRKVAATCREAFAGTGVEVQVEEDVSAYPLLSAVARASMAVPRHHPCVVRLEWRPRGPVKHTLVLCGKGVTYDTGGADLKTDGAMAGMSRDKGGAAAVAGVLHAAAALSLPHTRVVGLLGLVRNSIGEESFVSDEIVRSRAGVRVRIGNTDAEGRLVLADLLAAARELVADAPDPAVLSLATLTGHVYRAHGPYVGAIGNESAGELLDLFDDLGALWGEPMERSRPRREDYAMVSARSCAEDVVSSNRLPSVNTPRGHQFPFAFLDVAAGLRGGKLPFAHLDLAGAAVDPPDWQFGRPTAVPVLTLTAHLLSLCG